MNALSRSKLGWRRTSIGLLAFLIDFQLFTLRAGEPANRPRRFMPVT